MKSLFGTLLLSFIIGFTASSQNIIYANVLRADDRSMNFEVLGNFEGNTLIYKNKDRSHRVTIYDNNMKIVNDVDLKFISDKTFNIDFVTFPTFFYAIYQYQRGNSVYSNAAKIDSKGNLVGDVTPLDTTRIGFFADRKVYYLTVSENKEQILLYKMQTKGDKIDMSAFLYNKEMKRVDQTKTTFSFDPRKQLYNDFAVANDGTFYFTKETTKGRRDYNEKLELFYKRPRKEGLYVVDIPILDKRIDQSQLKIDNQNDRIFLTSFLYKENYYSIDGVYVTALSKDSLKILTTNAVVFSDSLRRKLTITGSDNRSPFDNFSIRSIIAKRDKGILITLENSYTEDRGFNRGRFDRFGNYYDPFYYGNNNFYQFQRGYYDNYYWPYSSRSNNRDILYNFNDVIMLNLDGNLTPTWESIINKTQSAIESDNYLSYSMVNVGGALHFLYLLKDKNKEIISDNAVQPSGQIVRNPTIKAGEKGFNFMPRLAKQVSANAVIIPATYKNDIGFSKVFF